jgi:hypothetical protein
MNWIDAVSNPEGLREVFQGDPPLLAGVAVHTVSVDREGPTLRLRFDLPEYPANPPAKWQRSRFNTVQVELLFGAVRELSVNGVSTNVVADIEIQNGGGVILEMNSPTMRVSARAASVTISRMSAYLDGSHGQS